jgi:hypothetical protein
MVARSSQHLCQRSRQLGFSKPRLNEINLEPLDRFVVVSAAGRHVLISENLRLAAQVAGALR